MTVELLLRLIPGVLPDGTIGHTAVLHPIDAHGQALGVPPGDVAAGFRVRLVQTDDGWGASIVVTEPAAPLDPDAPPDTSVPSSPWRHRVTAPDTVAAAAAVRAASPEDRRARLEDLVVALAGR